jgi:hypothetical protein
MKRPFSVITVLLLETNDNGWVEKLGIWNKFLTQLIIVRKHGQCIVINL